MITLVKHEWHQVDSQFACELTEEILSEIYPDLDDDEITAMMNRIENGEISVDEIIDDAYENDVEIEWERQYDDWWTDRKGGYDVTYELGDENSWHEEPKPAEPTHKCTKCRWTGQSYETGNLYHREDGSVIEDYWESEEESHHVSNVCPMCDSDVVFTEHGVEQDKRMKEIYKELEELDFDEDSK